jgi:hypothetical protein
VPREVQTVLMAEEFCDFKVFPRFSGRVVVVVVAVVVVVVVVLVGVGGRRAEGEGRRP